jgi:acetyl esterase/lipase
MKPRGLAAALLCVTPLLAQTNVVPLYSGAAPGSENWTQKEAEYKDNLGLRIVRNVAKPTITVYLPPPEFASGASVVIAPGGAFRILSWDSEGTLVAEWLQRHGVAAFVLKYRLSDTGTEEEYAKAEAARAEAAKAAAARTGPAPAAAGAPARSTAVSPQQAAIRAMSAADGLRAIEVVRQNAGLWKLDPAKAGIMGFSAGGYVAMQAALEHTPANRPAFVGAIYACCENPAEIKVPDDAPPVFFLHAYNDPVAVSSPSLYLLWKGANKPAELHSYAGGGHGFGVPKRDRPTDGWMERFGDWLRWQGLMK